MTAMKSSKFSEVNESHKQPYCQESKYGGRRKRSSLLLIVAIEVLGALAAEAYTIKYFDCNNADKIHRYQMNELCENEYQRQNKTKGYKLLQRIKRYELDGFSCKVTRTTFTFYCGVYAHLKLMKIPDIELNVPLNNLQCMDMVTRQTYTTPDGKQHRIIIQDEVNIKSQDLGVLHDGDNSVSCEGQEIRIGEHIIQDALQLSQYKILVQKQKYELKKGRIEVTGDHLRLPKTCKITSGTCRTASKTYTWTPPNSKCELEEIRKVKLRPVREYLVDDENKILLKPLGTVPAPSRCPTASLITTEYPDVLLAEKGKFPMMGNDVRMNTYIQGLADYTLYSAENLIEQTTIQAKLKLCKQKYQLEDDVIHHVEGPHFVSRKGDVAYLFQCKEKTGTIQPRQKCFKDIPIEGGFINAISRVFTQHSAPTRCNQNFPLEIQSNEGWITLNPQPTQVQAPAELPLEHYVVHHNDLAGGGMYTTTELENWQDHLEEGNYADAIVGTLSYGVCVNSGSCGNEGDTSENFDLSRLNPLVETLEQLSPWAQLDKFLTKNAAYLAAIVILIEVIKVLITITIMVTTFLREGIQGLGAIAFMTCCGQLHKYQKLRQRAAKLRRRANATEMHDLHDQQVLEGEL